MINKELQNRAFQTKLGLRTLIFTKTKAYLMTDDSMMLELYGSLLPAWSNIIMGKKKGFIITEIPIKSLLTHGNPKVRGIAKDILDV